MPGAITFYGNDTPNVRVKKLNQLVGLSGGGSYQPLDSDLTAIAALTTTSFGRGLLALANAGALRTEAGLVIGTDVQAYDADLAAIAALSTTSFGRGLLALADAAALRSAAGLVIGTDVQAYDGDLAAIAALSTTSYGRAFLALADAAAARTAAGAAASGAIGSSGLTMATARLLGRITASTGAVEEVSVGTGLLLNAGTLSSTGTTLIEEYTGDGMTGTKTFSSLGAFTSLRIVFLGRTSDGTTQALNVQFNGDTGSNYDRQLISAASTTVQGAESIGATSAQIGVCPGTGVTAGLVGNGEALIIGYSGTTFHKGGVGQYSFKSNNSSAGTTLRTSVFHWRSTSAITSITVALAAGNYVTGSKLWLYGII